MEVALGATPRNGPGFSIHRLPSAAAGVDATSVKAGVCRMFKIIGKVNALADRYLKLYDKATAPVVGTDVPVLTIPLTMGQAFNIDFLHGVGFVNGLAYAITNAAPDSDTTATTAGDVVGLNILYL